MVSIYKIISIFFIVVLGGCAALQKIDESSIPDKREFLIDNEVNPCDNFYNYACNKVIEKFILRDDRSRHLFAFSDQYERILNFKKNYFKDLPKRNPQDKIEKEIRSFYLSCMDRDNRSWEERNLIREVKDDLDKIKTRDDFLNYISFNNPKIHTHFLAFDNVNNFDRPNYYDISFSIPLSILPELSYLENENLVDDLKNVLAEFYQIIGFDEEDSKKRGDKILSFQKEFLKVYPTHPEIFRKTYERSEIKRSDLINKYSNLRLKKLLERNVPRKTLIRNIVGDKSFSFLNDKLGNLPLDELKNLYLFYSLFYALDESNPDFLEKKNDFRGKYLGGSPIRESLQERCTKITDDYFTMEVDYILLPKLYPDFPRERFMKMVERIRDAFSDTIRKNNWLSEKSKKEALRKFKKTRFNMVSPNSISEWDFNLRRDYVKNQYLRNIKVFQKMDRERKLSQLGQPIDINKWELGPLTVNAYFEPSLNLMVFPIAILQPPFYDPSVSDDINLGAIGMVIAHELGHSIDDQGSTYNADGIKKEWMTKEDRLSFEERTRPLISYFDEIGHNGKFTLGENIGDFVGVEQSFKAAFKMNPERKGETKINQDLKREFFLAYARLWCNVTRDSYKKLLLKIDPHSQGEARVNQQLRLNKDFQEVYQCQEGDSMVAPKEKRVEIW